MPETPEHLLNQLDSPHWKTAGSTRRRPEGPTARRTGGGAPVNLTVLDQIAGGRRRLALAAEALAAGRADQAHLIRRAVALRALILTGETGEVRMARCPYCGTQGLLWSGGQHGRAVCANRHCTPIAGTPRRWTVEEILADRQAATRPTFTGEDDAAPVDLVDLTRAVAFLQPTGNPISRNALDALLKRYGVRTWRTGGSRKLLASLSDVLVAHALWVQQKTGACDTADTDGRPACIGLSGLYTPATDPARTAARTAAAARVCSTCPLRSTCSDSIN